MPALLSASLVLLAGCGGSDTHSAGASDVGKTEAPKRAQKKPATNPSRPVDGKGRQSSGGGSSAEGGEAVATGEQRRLAQKDPTASQAEAIEPERKDPPSRKAPKPSNDVPSDAAGDAGGSSDSGRSDPVR